MNNKPIALGMLVLVGILGFTWYWSDVRGERANTVPSETPGGVVAPSTPVATTTPVVPTTTPSTTKPGATKPVSTKPLAACKPTGCSAHVCSDQNVITTCEYRETYACYKTAKCERQASGQCGWTETAELRSCLMTAAQ